MPRGGKREKAGRKTTWESGVKFEETSPIRVPNHIKDKLLKIAHRLDSGEDFDSVFNSERQYLQELKSNLALAELEKKKLFEETEKYRLDLETESKIFQLKIYELEQKNLDLQNKLVTKSEILVPDLVTESMEHVQTELFNKIINNSTEFLKPLTSIELSRRFGKHDDFVKKKKFYYKDRLEEFLALLKQLDPQGIGWQYLEKDKKYYPILETQNI